MARIGRLAGIVGAARTYASKNPDKVNRGLDRVGDQINKRTGGKHAGAISKASNAARKALGTGRGGSDSRTYRP